MDKKSLMIQLQKDWKKYWQLDFFVKNGWKRSECRKCGKFFWSLKRQDICNDSSCKPYEFLDRKLMNKKYDYFTAWDAIRKFFEKNEHSYLERYPTVCTWFPLYFTIAGIVDFYRMDHDKFVFEFPKSPVILLQPSLRFNDIENVGKTGRHWTCHGHIEQAGTSYWKEKAIELDFELLTKVFGIDPKEINFIEDVWLGAGAFGYSLEYHVAGLELGNCVFTEFSGTPDDYERLDPPVIDMGAGIERFVWMSQQTPTSYEAVLGPVIKKMKKMANVEYDDELFMKYTKVSGKLNMDEVADIEAERKELAKELGLTVKDLEEKIEPIQALYAIADHARAICYAITDGGVPSNIGGGYNLRVVMRRSFEFIERFKFNFDFVWACKEVAEFFSPINPELKKNVKTIEKVVKLEHEKYLESKDRMKNVLKGVGEITEEKMIELYDSHGITPEMLKQFNPKVKIPSDFYKKITERHMKAAPVKEEVCIIDLPKTDKSMVYKKIFEFEAKVLDANGDRIILDKTAFYPTSGGQEFDKGTISGCRVYNVNDCNGVAVHYVEKPSFKKGDRVKCVVDKKAREQIMRHHTGAHVINLACQKVLGPHIWQEGSKKDVDKAHLDISHYDNITDSEAKQIERVANDLIKQRLVVTKEVLPRMKAEQKYGFRIYQGAPVPLKELTIVSVGDDHEACGGLHIDNTYNLEEMYIMRTSRIQDGVFRIEFVAGHEAIKKMKEKIEKLRNEEAYFSEKKKKEFEKKKELLKTAKRKIEPMFGVNYIDTDDMKVADLYTKFVEKDSDKYLVLIGNGFVLGIKGSKCKTDIEKIVKEIAIGFGGKAGGRDNVFRGGGPKKELAKKIYEKFK